MNVMDAGGDIELEAGVGREAEIEARKRYFE